MFATSKIKWFGSIILAGTLLVLALMGGKWGTNYSASASVNATPVIDYIQPSALPAGSLYRVMIIFGSNFGNLQDTTVRLTGVGVNQTISPIMVIPDGISLLIPADLLDVPTLYLVTVIVSDYDTIPTIPITPHDHESNPVPFTVYEGQFIHLPIVTNNARP
jgi:hypothetical protein